MTDDDHEDLAILELTVRSLMADAGVRVSPTSPATHRPPDVYFVYPTTQPGALIDMLTMMTPAIVFVSAEQFDVDEFETSDDNLRAAAQAHDGDVRQVTATWARDGLLFQWLATADWHDHLLDESEVEAYQARGLDQMELELVKDSDRKARRKMTELVLASPEFRGATTNKRTAQARLIMNAHPDVLDDVLFEKDFITDVRRLASFEVARWEQELGGDGTLPAQIAGKLTQRSSQTQQKRQVAEMLRERADGWALSESFVEQVWMEARSHIR